MKEKEPRRVHYGWMDRELFPDRIALGDIVEWTILGIAAIAGFILIGIIVATELSG